MPKINGQFVPESQLGGQQSSVSTQSPGGGGSQQFDLAEMLKRAMAMKLLQSNKLTNQAKGVDLLQPSAAQEQARLKSSEKSQDIADAEKRFRSLEDVYMGGGSAKGPIGGIGTQLVSGDLLGIPGFRIDPNTDYATYKDLLKSSLAGFAKAGGDTGNIGFLEQLLQLHAFPGARATPDVAKRKFNLLRTKYGLPEREDWDTLPGQKNAGASLYGSSLKLDK